MARVHAPELEDYDWFPTVLRDGLTDALRGAAERLRVFDAALPVLAQLLAESDATRIVDLCSGGGGPVLHLFERLTHKHGRPLELVLTDKFPNHSAFTRAEQTNGGVRAHRASVDASDMPGTLTGLRTLFNALHHFRPPQARAIFADAARQNQPIVSFEVVERSLQGALIVSGVPLITALITPLLEPRSLQRFALTYLAPVIPSVMMWDGFASCLRAYSPTELHALVAGLARPDYEFRVVQSRSLNAPFRVTALIGLPLRVV
jgi:hypothetical protein